MDEQDAGRVVDSLWGYPVHYIKAAPPIETIHGTVSLRPTPVGYRHYITPASLATALELHLKGSFLPFRFEVSPIVREVEPFDSFTLHTDGLTPDEFRQTVNYLKGHTRIAGVTHSYKAGWVKLYAVSEWVTDLTLTALRKGVFKCYY